MGRLKIIHLYSIYDIVVILWSGCFIKWIEILTHGQVNLKSLTDCKLIFFLFYFGRHYSSTLLVLMSVEKCFAVYFPLKSITVCTVRTAKWATGIVGVILAGYDILHVWHMEPQFIKSYGVLLCAYMTNYFKILFAVDSALYSFGPFILMSMTNFAIVFKFMAAKCKNKSIESTNQALAKSATRGTAMVVTVSVTFLILTAPTALHAAFSDLIQVSNNPMYHVFMNLTQYLNHSINGLLYCIVGSRFCNQLVNIICRKEKTSN